MSAIDGKTRRRSHDRTSGQTAVHRVSAWATANHLVRGPGATDDHSNELTAVPALLPALALEGRTIRSAARGCQTAIAEQIAAGGGYVLARKDNQPTMHDLVAHHVAVPASDAGHRTLDQDHGRLEVRQCRRHRRAAERGDGDAGDAV